MISSVKLEDVTVMGWRIICKCGSVLNFPSATGRVWALATLSSWCKIDGEIHCPDCAEMKKKRGEA